MSDGPKKRRRAWIGWGLVLVFVLYPLSVGPVTWFVTHGHSGLLADWDTAYAPLFWACNRSDALSSLLSWYMGLWVRQYSERPVAPPLARPNPARGSLPDARMMA